mmetsp:Transcript_15610/g.42040  ORF Transcript_15610/g.42040 Transcript_15610/m.42040 type:complete len:202 (+) Transcript_15610:21-626(+)
MSARERRKDAVRTRNLSRLSSSGSVESLSLNLAVNSARRVYDDSMGWAQNKPPSKRSSRGSEMHRALSKAEKQRTSVRELEEKFAGLDYFKIANVMRASIKVKDRFVGLRRIECCVTAQEVVAWLMKAPNTQCQVASKEEALFLGSMLIEHGHLYAVADQKEDGFGFEFRSNGELLQFSCDAREIAKRKDDQCRRSMNLRL